MASSSMGDEESRPLRRTGGLADSSESDEVSEVFTPGSDDDEPVGSGRDFSPPTLSTRAVQHPAPPVPASLVPETGNVPALPSAITLMAGMIWEAIDNQRWERLGNLLDSMHEQNFRFDSPEWKSSVVAQRIVEAAPLALLADTDDSSEGDTEKKWMLALDLVDLGCNRNAADAQGYRVIDLLFQRADHALIEYVASERPDLKKALFD